jgi:TRAP-type C4-dicarboxylate transport system permease small subunit
MSTFLETYKKWMDRLAKVEAFASMLMMASLILMNGVGIFTRYFLNRPILWVHELTILIGTWLFYVGMGLLYARREDISLDLIVNKMPERMRWMTEQVIHWMILLFLVILTIATYNLIPFRFDAQLFSRYKRCLLLHSGRGGIDSHVHSSSL